jgi:2,4-dienoyl-CoA reductase-like NADH-dependent reductase (Old Yellow Enzyme family)
MSGHLFAPLRLGELTLPNRIVMPFTTRARTAAGEVRTDMMDRFLTGQLIISQVLQMTEWK